LVADLAEEVRESAYGSYLQQGMLSAENGDKIGSMSSLNIEWSIRISKGKSRMIKFLLVKDIFILKTSKYVSIPRSFTILFVHDE